MFLALGAQEVKCLLNIKPCHPLQVPFFPPPIYINFTHSQSLPLPDSIEIKSITTPPLICIKILSSFGVIWRQLLRTILIHGKECIIFCYSHRNVYASFLFNTGIKNTNKIYKLTQSMCFDHFPESPEHLRAGEIIKIISFYSQMYFHTYYNGILNTYKPKPFKILKAKRPSHLVANHFRTSSESTILG